MATNLTNSQTTSLQPPETTTSFADLGKQCLTEADALKFSNCGQSQQLYNYAAAYFQKASSQISDPITRLSLQYLGETAKRNSDLIEKYTKNSGNQESKSSTSNPAPLVFALSEVDRGRPAPAGSRGKLSGVKHVPRSQPPRDDGYEDLLVLESKLAEIGLMPPSAVLLQDHKSPLTSSSARLDLLSSSLGESFMLLSTSGRGGGGQHQQHPLGYFPSTATAGSGGHQSPLPYGSSGGRSSDGLLGGVAQGGDILRREDRHASQTTPPGRAYGGSAADSTISSSRSGYVRPKSTRSVKAPSGMAYWGATAGGLLAWAAPGGAASGKSEEQGTDGWVGEEDAQQSNDIVWNDTSMMLSSAIMAEDGGSGEGAHGEKGRAGGAEDSEGVLRLLDTIDRLRSENNRLESCVDSLRVEKKKNDLLLVQVEAFKQEYRSRISAYKKKMKKLVALQQRQQGENRFLTLEENAVTADGGGVSSSGELKKLGDLERIIKELLGKIKELKVDNDRKEEALRRYREARRSVEGSNGPVGRGVPLSQPSSSQHPQTHKHHRQSKSEGIAHHSKAAASRTAAPSLHIDAPGSIRSSPQHQHIVQSGSSSSGGGDSAGGRPSPRASAAALRSRRTTAKASSATTTLQTALKREMTGSGYSNPMGSTTAASSASTSGPSSSSLYMAG